MKLLSLLEWKGEFKPVSFWSIRLVPSLARLLMDSLPCTMRALQLRSRRGLQIVSVHASAFVWLLTFDLAAVMQIVNGVRVLPQVLGSFVDLGGLFEKAAALFANADAVVAYNRMELDTAALNAKPINHEVNRQSALGGRAVYSTCLKVWEA